MISQVRDYVQKNIPADQVLYNEPLASHTTFHVGGPCEMLVSVHDMKQLTGLLQEIRSADVPMMILGNGSNLLVSDKGYNGVMIKLEGEFTSVSVEGDVITAGGGALLAKVARDALGAELTGLEFASGIPGSVGGGVIMNAGAYDGEMKMVVEKVTLVDLSGHILEKNCEDMKFAYRTSFAKAGGYIVTGVRLKLSKGDKADILAKMDDFAARRRDKQPLEYPSAGSTFKRPEGFFAGKLIDDAGLRGYRVGDAQVSEKHCGFVINVGNATATDINRLMEDVTGKVELQFGVTLEPEVIKIGEF